MPGQTPCIEIFLQPGEYFVGNADYRIRTLLGSCVSITLWHPCLRIGAMSHFLLASRPAHVIAEPDGRYGEEAMWLMLRELRAAGITPRECQGKVFGGGDMFPGARAAPIHVGKRNGETARELLRAHGIPILSESLFGVGHRQIIFDVSSGNVWSRQVKPG
ncbi:MAG TPA: chemotaxis protein CheD [Noviherbaspirillum sp.]|uniref:chemotaxis protein CheD n=1 Tax=Noviherbaspirillum sp. TaxID=1926288 RepID=UPI002B4A6971|nr:chemotaxis protein CheD [Noviherbaspirillum sp.]HJV86084.1 chemotaxis protein CheD [Noviherbaspirillum sp.]